MISFAGNKKVIKGHSFGLRLHLNKLALQHHKVIKELLFVFVDDEFLLEMNKSVLQHDFYTDIITFDYTEQNLLEGEIYISIDRVRENSEIYQVAFHVELIRVMFHGLLHMLGFKDKSKTEKEKMRQMENACLDMYFKGN